MSASNPFAPPSADLGSLAPSPDGGAPLASRGTRLAAALLDTVLYVPAMIPLFVLVIFEAAKETLAEAGEATGGGELAAIGTGVFALMAFGLACYQWYLISTTGQSLAKRWLKIRIVKLDGTAVNFVSGVLMRVWVVALLGFVPFVGSLVGLVDPLMIFGDERRCLHDYIAGTKVVQVG